MNGAFDTETDGSRLDELFSVLADEHRRQVLRYFRTCEVDEVEVERLVEYLDGVDSASERGPVAWEVYHVTLPKLADADVVEYDWDTVRYSGDPLLEELVDFLLELEDRDVE